MLEPFEFKGLWHLPEKPSEKVAGILKYCQSDGIKLELIGTFQQEDDNPILYFTQKGSHPIIYGETSDGKYISLINCHKSGSYNFSCSFPLINFAIDYIFQGYYLEDFDEAMFDYIELSNASLSNWIARNTHNLKIQFGEDEQYATFEIGPKNNQTFKFQIDAEIELELSIGSYFSSGENNSYYVRQESFCRIYSKRKLNISMFIKKAELFNSFVSIGLLQNLPLSYVKFYSKGVQKEVTTSPTKEFPMYLLYKQNIDAEVNSKSRKLFTFNDIEKNFGGIIKQWFATNEELLPIRNHLMDAIEIKTVFKSVDFLILAFALEGYFSRFRVKDTSLKVVVVNLIEEFENVNLIKGLAIVPDQLNDSRNYYAHLFDKNKKKNVLFGEDLYKLTQKLKLLLICCLLKEIGFNDEMINDSISKSGMHT